MSGRDTRLWTAGKALGCVGAATDGSAGRCFLRARGGPGPAAGTLVLAFLRQVTGPNAVPHRVSAGVSRPLARRVSGRRLRCNGRPRSRSSVPRRLRGPPRRMRRSLFSHENHAIAARDPCPARRARHPRAAWNALTGLLRFPDRGESNGKFFDVRLPATFYLWVVHFMFQLLQRLTHRGSACPMNAHPVATTYGCSDAEFRARQGYCLTRCTGLHLRSRRRHGREVMQRTANPSSPVRFRMPPPII